MNMKADKNGLYSGEQLNQIYELFAGNTLFCITGFKSKSIQVIVNIDNQPVMVTKECYEIFGGKLNYDIMQWTPPSGFLNGWSRFSDCIVSKLDRLFNVEGKSYSDIRHKGN